MNRYFQFLTAVKCVMYSLLTLKNGHNVLGFYQEHTEAVVSAKNIQKA